MNLSYELYKKSLKVDKTRKKILRQHREVRFNIDSRKVDELIRRLDAILQR